MEDARALAEQWWGSEGFHVPDDGALTCCSLTGTGYYEPDCEHRWCDLPGVDHGDASARRAAARASREARRRRLCVSAAVSGGYGASGPQRYRFAGVPVTHRTPCAHRPALLAGASLRLRRSAGALPSPKRRSLQAQKATTRGVTRDVRPPRASPRAPALRRLLVGRGSRRLSTAQIPRAAAPRIRSLAIIFQYFGLAPAWRNRPQAHIPACERYKCGDWRRPP